MSVNLFFAGLSAVIGGMLVAAQGPIYAKLSEELNRDPLAAVFVAFLTATFVIGLLILASGSWRSISATALIAIPYWVWLGGLLGACHVMISMQVIPATGATVFLVLVIAGNLIGASIYDHIGAFGLIERPLSMARLVGVMVVFAGAIATVRS